MPAETGQTQGRAGGGSMHAQRCASRSAAGSPAPSGTSGAPSGLVRTASLGMLPEPSGQPPGGPEPADGQPTGRARSAGTLERTRFLPARSTRVLSELLKHLPAYSQARPSCSSGEQ